MSFKPKRTGEYKDMYHNKINISHNIMKRISTPFPIMKRIDEMKSHMDNIYYIFYNELTDRKLQKKIEEYKKFKKAEKMHLTKILKGLTYYFEQKIKDIKLKRSKSIGNIIDTGLLYSKIIKHYKNESKSRSYFPYLLPIKKEESMRIKCITEYNMINVIKKIRAKKLTKRSINLSRTQRLNIQRLSSLINTKEFSSINKKHSSKSIIFKKLINKNSKDSLSENNYNFNNINPSTPSMRYQSAINKKYSLISPKRNLRVYSGKCESKNNYSINKKFDKDLLRRKLKSIFEIKQRAFKILPKLSNSFNMTLSKSSNIKNDLRSFQNEETMRSEHSKMKNQKIIKKFFPVYKQITIKSTLKIANAKKKSVSFKSIIENLKYVLNKKEKSPLCYVEDYNKMRNRRRKNKEIDKNIGFMFDSTSKKKNKKSNVYLGMSFKDVLK